MNEAILPSTADEGRFVTAGVAPLRPSRPCFATPVFRGQRSNALWYQLIGSNGLLEGFGEVDLNLSARVFAAQELIERRVGDPAVYAFLSTDQRIFLGDRRSLRPQLREEIESLQDRPHLRHSIAKFIGDRKAADVAMRDISKYWHAYSTELHNEHRRVFISYAHADAEMAREFRNHMNILEEDQRLNIWMDSDITVGQRWDQMVSGMQWKQAVNAKIASSDIFILLLSPNFLASHYLHDLELPAIRQRVDTAGGSIIPVLLRPCDWQLIALDRQVTPTDNVGRVKAISRWASKAKGYARVMAQIGRAMRNRSQSAPGANAKSKGSKS